MSGSITYVFYAIDKPLSAAQRAQVRKLSSRVYPTARRAEFWYQVEGYDIPNGYEPLMARYYDIMVRQDYELWTLGIAFPYRAELYQTLAPFECEAGDGCGLLLEKLDAKSKAYSTHKVVRPTRLLVEISGYLDYDVAESLIGLRGDLPWDSAVEREDEDSEDGEDDDWDDEWDDDDEGYDYENDSIEENLARLANHIREDALRGDLRAFYLVWKRFGSQSRTRTSRQTAAAPAVPRNLTRLPAHLKPLPKLLRSEPE